MPVDEDALGRLNVVSGDGHRSAHVPEGVLHKPCKHNHDARTTRNSSTLSYKLRVIATAKRTAFIPLKIQIWTSRCHVRTIDNTKEEIPRT